ncbi:uncharacterized protein N7477_004235 [Penicillium maclennaniae]|uniref:uncharacterized protein n=1 Tax=Penicillium maclennaniae TaxID=1343394 RepID=UPI00253FD7B4|nr:uncharacterized protein N7477_004235 [Penicillium maclennaniae]KAJ5674301.1 hypothetical protein N7477_004235 [Penicillium maclennaniae]
MDVKLKHASQWHMWIDQVWEFAEQLHVWHLCNPELAFNELEVPLQKPKQPAYPEEDDTQGKKEWRDRLDLFNIQYDQWRMQNQGLVAMNQYIVRHLANDYRHLVIGKHSAYEKLRCLSARFGLDTSYKEEVRVRWKLHSMDKPTGDIEAWADKWNALRVESLRLKFPDFVSAN